MSDKRILIQEYDENPCLSCTNDCKKYPCEAKREWVLGACIKGPDKNYKRSEAIEKMAKALCRTYGEDCETCRFNGNEKGCKRYLEFQNYIAMAEAALNELLESNDNEK